MPIKKKYSYFKKRVYPPPYHFMLNTENSADLISSDHDTIQPTNIDRIVINWSDVNQCYTKTKLDHLKYHLILIQNAHVFQWRNWLARVLIKQY